MDSNNLQNNNFFVLSAPHYFTDVERCAMLDAARYFRSQLF
jgi:hypothetical protein